MSEIDASSDPECCNKTYWWLVWLLIGLAVLFLVIIIILRGLCTDVWYISLLGLNDKLCSEDETSIPQSVGQRLSLDQGKIILSNGGGDIDVKPLIQTEILALNLSSTPGPPGSIGLNGINGATGASGAIGVTGATGAIGPMGPAGPTDPCGVASTYHCQGGNTFGTTSVLGTSDANAVNVITGGLINSQFDLQGNFRVERAEAYFGNPTIVNSSTLANILINENVSGPTTFSNTILPGNVGNMLVVDNATIDSITGTIGHIVGGSTVTNFTGAFLGVSGGSTVIDSAYFSGGLVAGGAVVDNLGGLTGLVNGGSITDAQGLNGYFNNSDITDSFYLMGNFAGTTIADSAAIFGQTGSGASIIDSGNMIVYLNGGSIANSDQSLITTNGLTSSIDDVDFSLAVGDGVLSATNIYESILLGSNNTISNTNNSSLVSRDSDIADADYSSIIGNNLDLTGLDHSIYVGNNTTLDADADPTYDYSFIGTDSAGTINTRINYKGDDSWLNLSGGNVGIGTTTPGQKLDVGGTIRQSNAISCAITANASGDLQCVSDERLKDVNGLYEGGLEELVAINTIKFNYIGEDYNHVGFSAQNVGSVLPEATPIQGNGYLGLDSNAILALVVNSVKEQNGKLEETNQTLKDAGVQLISISEELKALSRQVKQNTSDIELLREEVKQLKEQLKGQPNTPTNPNPNSNETIGQ